MRRSAARRSSCTSVQKRPLTAASWCSSGWRAPRARRTAGCAAVAVTWLPGQGPGRVRHAGPARRRSERPHPARAPPLAARQLDARSPGWRSSTPSAINTLDSYVEEDGRHFVRHYFIDFGAGLGSATSDVKGPHDGGQYIVEVGRSLASLLSLGLYRRPYQSQRGRVDRGGGASTRRSASSRPRTSTSRRSGPNRKVPGAHADDRPRRLLGRQAGDVVHRRAARAPSPTAARLPRARRRVPRRARSRSGATSSAAAT